jgi:thymidylate kinase
MCSYEEKSFQGIVRKRFDVLKQQTDEVAPGTWQVIDARGSIADIHADLKRRSEALMKDVEEKPLRRLWDAAPLA